MLINNAVENWREALDGAFPNEAAAEFGRAVMGRYIVLGDWVVGHDERDARCTHTPSGGQAGRQDGVTPCNRIVGRGQTALAAIEDAREYFEDEDAARPETPPRTSS